MWIVLKGDENGEITKKNLLVFILAILGIKFQYENEGKNNCNAYNASNVIT